MGVCTNENCKALVKFLPPEEVVKINTIGNVRRPKQTLEKEQFTRDQIKKYITNKDWLAFLTFKRSICYVRGNGVTFTFSIACIWHLIIVLSYDEKKRRNQLWTLKIPITFLQKQKNQKENTAMTTALPPNVNAA